MYDPDRDFYELLSVSADATEVDIREQIARLQGVEEDADLDDASEVLLNLHSRTRYDAQRATHRMCLLLRASVPVFSGRTPAEGVPVYRAQVGTSLPAPKTMRVPRDPKNPAPNPLTVLVVDDDADTRDSIGAVLEERGYKVNLAEDGQRAYNYLATRPAPACMVLDLWMPVMDGWSLASKMGLGRLPSVPIVVITAADERFTYPVPIRQVLRKPVNVDRMLMLVAELAGPATQFS
jgi:CheY-like chemotaxis protein